MTRAALYRHSYPPDRIQGVGDSALDDQNYWPAHTELHDTDPYIRLFGIDFDINYRALGRTEIAAMPRPIAQRDGRALRRHTLTSRPN
jgi:hypothetical protein